MDINSINLTTPLLVSLFENSLVKEGSPKMEPSKKRIIKEENPEATPSLIKYLGKNEGEITMIIHDANHQFLGEKENELLAKLLSAGANRNIGHLAIINFAHQPVHFTQIKQELAPKLILIMGEHQKLQGIPEIIYLQPLYFQGANIILCPSLTEMLGENEIVRKKKTDFWNVVKSHITLK